MRKSDRVRTSPSSSVLSNAPFGLSRTPKKRERERGRRGREREREREIERTKRDHIISGLLKTHHRRRRRTTPSPTTKRKKKQKKHQRKRKPRSPRRRTFLIFHISMFSSWSSPMDAIFCLLFCVYLLKNNVQFFFGRKRCVVLFFSLPHSFRVSYMRLSFLWKKEMKKKRQTFGSSSFGEEEEEEEEERRERRLDDEKKHHKSDR